MLNPPPVAPSGSVPAVRADLRNRHHQVEVPAELVDLRHVARDERGAFLVSEVGVGNGGTRVLDEAGAQVRVLLEVVQETVDRVAAHHSLHSTAARVIRGSSPKYRTSARAGVMAPRSTIQFRNSWLPVLCNSSAVRSSSGSCSPRSIHWISFRSNTVSVSPTRPSNSSGKCDRPPVAIMPTAQGLFATTRA